jgi:hypothetical protein
MKSAIRVLLRGGGIVSLLLVLPSVPAYAQTDISPEALQQMQELLKAHMVRRKVDPSALEFKEPERAADILRYLGRKPLVVAIATAATALLIAKPRQTVAWLGYALTTYTMIRRARRVLFSRE